MRLSFTRSGQGAAAFDWDHGAPCPFAESPLPIRSVARVTVTLQRWLRTLWVQAAWGPNFLGCAPSRNRQRCSPDLGGEVPGGLECDTQQMGLWLLRSLRRRDLACRRAWGRTKRQALLGALPEGGAWGRTRRQALRGALPEGGAGQPPWLPTSSAPAGARRCQAAEGKAEATCCRVAAASSPRVSPLHVAALPAV